MTFDLHVLISNWGYFAAGLGGTLLICAVALPVGFTAGTGLAVVELRCGRILRTVVRAYIESIRNIPFLMLVFLLYFALPATGIKLEPAMAGIIALSAYAAAYFSEIVRGAIEALPRGQSEAAAALGLTFQQSFRWVLLPQSLSYLIPAGVNLAITLVKESAILSVITVRELTFMSQDVIGRSFAPVEVFTLLALLYWLLTNLLTRVSDRIERVLQPHLSRSVHLQHLE